MNRRLTALIADDVLASRELLCHMLNRLDVDVLVQVADGAKVLAKLAQQPVDIAFLDIDMPGQTGLEVLESINSLSKAPWTIIVSAHSTSGNFQKAIDHGAKGFVVKPYTMAKIRQMIGNCVQVRHGSRSGPSR
ncbi:MAG: response regulator [Gammaproteobacteria bacterium]|nr:response regulator [Gammaproteobacteria bacterium]